MTQQQESSSLAASMAELARNLHRTMPLKEILVAIALGAKDNTPGADFAGVSIRHKAGRMETVAATDPIVDAIDQVQYDLNEGPCVDAINGQHRQVMVEDLAADPRWPRYAPAGAAMGIGSQLGIELYDDEHTVGGLNLYACRDHAFDDQSVEMAYLFAVHAAHALGRAMTRTHLTEALESRTVIAQAVGIVMERYKLTDSLAFAYLTRISQTRNVRLRVVASEIVTEVASQRG